MLVDEGATWAVTFAGTTRRLRDSKGLRDLAVLLGRPQQEVHCLELAGGTDVGGDTGPALDERRPTRIPAAHSATSKRTSTRPARRTIRRAPNGPRTSSTPWSNSSARRSACPGAPAPEAQQPSGRGQR